MNKEGTHAGAELFRGGARLLTQEGESLWNSGIEALSVSSRALTVAFLYIDHCLLVLLPMREEGPIGSGTNEPLTAIELRKTQN